MRHVTAALLLSATLLGAIPMLEGCATSPDDPEAAPGALLRPASEPLAYELPRELGPARLSVSTEGIRALRAASGGRVLALKIRVALANLAGSSEGTEWRLDPRDQRLALAGHGTSAPAYARSTSGEPLPLILVPAASQRVVDLYFPLPAGLTLADEVPRGRFEWRATSDPTLSRGARGIAPLDRLPIPDAPATDEADVASSGEWWQAPAHRASTRFYDAQPEPPLG